MLPVLTIVNDFLPVSIAVEIRNHVLNLGFDTETVDEGIGNSVDYENVQMQWMPTEFADYLPQVFGCMPIKMHQQAFRLGFHNSQLHNLVHSDHCCARLAAVYYMNHLEDCRGGTAFWRHRKHSWEFMPDPSQLEAAKYTIEELAEDWHDPNAWDLVSIAGMKPNRLIVYPTAAFHSRWPWEGFGSKDDPERARLIWCGFFDIL